MLNISDVTRALLFVPTFCLCVCVFARPRALASACLSDKIEI